MTTTNTMNGSPDIRVPSGFEVESATFHVPMTGEENVTFSESTSGRSGFRGKLDDVKARGLSKVHDVQHMLADRKTSLQRSISTAQMSMRDGMQRQMTSTQTSMRTSPMKWAGIAAGSGFAIGLLGRFMQRRNDHRHTHRHRLPDLVIIETSC